MVINKGTSGLFPIHENILGRDWIQITDATPSPVTPVAPGALVALIAPTKPELTVNTTSIKSIAKLYEDRKDLDDMKKLTINLNLLPADVKLVYEKCRNKEQIIKKDIKKFQNDLKIKPHDASTTQFELNFIYWPKVKLNFLIYKDGIIFWNLTDHIKDQQEKFHRSLMAIKEWSAREF